MGVGGGVVVVGEADLFFGRKWVVVLKNNFFVVLANDCQLKLQLKIVPKKDTYFWVVEVVVCIFKFFDKEICKFEKLQQPYPQTDLSNVDFEDLRAFTHATMTNRGSIRRSSLLQASLFPFLWGLAVALRNRPESGWLLNCKLKTGVFS